MSRALCENGKHDGKGGAPRLPIGGPLLGLLVLAGACDRLFGADEPDKPQWKLPGQELAASDPATTPADAGMPAPIEPPRPLGRAEKKLYFPAKGSTNLGFDLEGLSRLHALAGAIDVPEWSTSGDGDPKAMRDDDIATAWRCKPGEGSTCAAGLHLPRTTEIEALRLYAAAGPTIEAFEANPRPAKVRVHTDQGFVDVPLPDEQTHLYIVLGQPARTLNVTLEFLETHGKNDAPIHLAELEVYGESGAPRQPWNIDPRRTFVRLDEHPWKKTSAGWRLRTTHLEMIGDHAVARLTAGTSLMGKAGDRMLLLERMDRTLCERHEGTYFLIDQQTRVIAPLGELGGAGADIYRRVDGTGFAVGNISAADTTLHGITFERGEYRRKRTPARPDKRAPDTFEAWGLDREPLRRGGRTTSALPDGCVRGSDDRLTELRAALGEKGWEEKPGQWIVCELGDEGLAYVTARDPCGKGWEIHVLDAERTPVTSERGSGKGTHLRLERPSADLVLAEIGRASGDAELFRLTSTGVESLGANTSLALRPPAACRQSCDDPFRDPYAADPDRE